MVPEKHIWLNSSTRLNDKTQSPYKFGWQDGFAAFSVSELQLAKVARYIRNQKEHHRKIDFQAKLLELLQKNRIEFDEGYLWR
jgi:REP-associated tyrosine transposase